MPPKIKRPKPTTKEDLMELDKDQLAENIIKLQAHIAQLRGAINKSDKTETNGNKRKFDFSKCHYRHVLLRILYFGWDYQGFAVQEDTTQTIEHHLMQALQKSCLIDERQNSQYNRCGRTDKGVSSFGQVISIKLRSKHPPEDQHKQECISTEIEYCKMLNSLLPKEIRAIAWMPIPDDKPEYSSRFDCKKRQYKYYFPRSALNIAAMRDACSRIVGSHDFRHLCKMDVGNGVFQFRREIFKADILPVGGKESDEARSMYYLLIEGNAFLWHQIRCIMVVLLLVGEGKEAPDIMTELLDVEKNPRKPQYHMALDIPLNLFKCSYELEETIKWVYEKTNLRKTIVQLQNDWTIQKIKTTMINDSLQQLEAEYKTLCDETTDAANQDDGRIMQHTECLIQGIKPKVYTPLLRRQTCSSLEERINHYVKRRRIERPEGVADS